MSKIFKKYCFLRSILAKRLKKKRRYINNLINKNRVFTCGYGTTIDLSHVEMIKIEGYKYLPDCQFLVFYNKEGCQITSIKTDKSKENIEGIIDCFNQATKQLVILKSFLK